MSSGAQSVSAIAAAIYIIGFVFGYWVRGRIAEREMSRGVLTGPRESVNIYKPAQEVPALWK